MAGSHPSAFARAIFFPLSEKKHHRVSVSNNLKKSRADVNYFISVIRYTLVWYALF